MKTCTTLDHIYPYIVKGTPCYCGAQKWGGKAPQSQDEDVIDAEVEKEKGK